MQAPPVIGRSQRHAWWWVVAMLSAGLAAALVFKFNPSRYGFYPQCQFYRVTGLACPGCGCLRATHHLLHGHLLAALHCNALFVLGLPLLAFAAVRTWQRERAGQPGPVFVFPGFWLKIGVGVFVGFTILRNIPCSPFTWLFPPSGG